VSFQERLYALLLLAYPRSFRRQYADDMRAYFRRRRLDLAARPALTRGLLLWSEIAADAVRSLPRESIAALARAQRHLGRELRHATRALALRPGYAIAVVLTLALAIAANAAVFSLVDAVLLEPLPYPEPDRLVRIFEQNSPTNRWSLSVADWIGITEQHAAFSSIAALGRTQLTATGGERPERLVAAAVTAGFFDTLGVRPAEGRGFLPGDDRPGAAAVTVLSRAFADRYFGAQVEAVGRDVTLDGEVYRVAGVLAAGLDTLGGVRAEAWVPFKIEEPQRRGPFFLNGFGRLAEGSTLQQAASELEGVSRRLYPLWSSSFSDQNAILTPYALRDVVIGDAGRQLGLVTAAVLLLFAVAVANVANLMVTRAAERAGELRVRAALGAAPAQVATAMFAEALLLTGAASAAGLGLAAIALGALQRSGLALPRLADAGIDLRLVGWVAAFAVTASVLLGLTQLSVGASRRTLAAAGRTHTASRRMRRFRAALVVVEFSLTLPLLVAAALLVNSFLHLQGVDPGFDPDGLVVGRISLPDQTYAEEADVAGFWNAFEERARQIPGVTDVGLSGSLPPDLYGDGNNFDLLDRPVGEGRSQPVSPWSAATTDFFRTLGVPLVEGRLFRDSDADGLPVIVVTQAWAEHYIPGERAVGKQLVSGGCNTCDPTTIVGVVGDLKYDGLDSHGEAVFYPAVPARSHVLAFALRTAGAEGAALAAVEDLVRDLDPDLPVAELSSLGDRVAGNIAQPGRWATLLGTFALTAMLLAAVGVFGVMSFHVRQQLRDIAVRQALGADRGAVVRLVVGRGMALVASGMALGLALSLYAARYLEGFLFQVSATDPLTLGVIGALLAAVAFAACYGPAVHAAGVDPVRAIAAE